MISFNFDEFCSGCGACSNICPSDAINMGYNSEGFLIPTINKQKCVDCGKCEEVCVHVKNKTDSRTNIDNISAWLYASPDSEVKLLSSSGAACYELEKKIIEKGGMVAGCVWNDELIAVHELGANLDFVIKTQGSKYVQSKTGDIYKKVVEKLKEGNRIVFTGTPCQAVAMHNTVMATSADLRRNVIIISIICHGVASPTVWESYKEYIQIKEGRKLVSVNFRDKSKEGYKKSYCRYIFEDNYSRYMPTYLPGSKYIESTLVYNLGIRNSCSHCDCKGIRDSIDIIVGDWYAENKGDGFLGTSCVIACTKLGKDYICSSLDGLKDHDIELVYKDNIYINKSINKNSKRIAFFKNLSDADSWENVESLYPPKYKYKRILVKIGLYDLLKKFL